MQFLDSVVPHLLLWLVRVSILVFCLLGIIGIIEWIQGAAPAKGKAATVAEVPDPAMHALMPESGPGARWARRQQFQRPHAAASAFDGSVADSLSGASGQLGVVSAGAPVLRSGKRIESG